MGVGAYTGAVLGGEAGRVWGWGLPIWIWLPGAGIGAALVGILVAPVAVRLRGLYLAIVTLGLVFIGIHIGNTDWAARRPAIPASGRDFPASTSGCGRRRPPLVDMSSDGKWLWFEVTRTQKHYLFLAALMLRVHPDRQEPRPHPHRTGVPGDPRPRHRRRGDGRRRVQVQDHRVRHRSFFAGVAGICFASLDGKLPATSWSLFLSVEIIAILLIGGVGTVLGRPARHGLRRARASAGRGVHGMAVGQGRAGRHRRHRRRRHPDERAGRLRADLDRARSRRAGRSTSSTGTW